MTAITCPCVECIHNGKRYKCTAEKINFKYRNMATINEGRVDMWICNQYELTEEAKKIEEMMKNINRGG
ncbi:MAG: hypothetical protein IJR29_03750 [Butyrivibrio sp.]|nr:hypothetical protein [Butyrivibrio sp.]